MIKVVPFKKEHALAVKLQPGQSDNVAVIDDAYASDLEKSSRVAMTGIVGDRVVGCGGMVKLWPGRWLMWAILSEDARVHMVRATNICKRMLAMHDEPGRIEMIVKSDFKEAHRWAGLLGFKYHHHEERFLPDGSDADVYVRFV